MPALAALAAQPPQVREHGRLAMTDDDSEYWVGSLRLTAYDPQLNDALVDLIDMDVTVIVALQGTRVC